MFYVDIGWRENCVCVRDERWRMLEANKRADLALNSLKWGDKV